jgi:subtilisin family serine protease
VIGLPAVPATAQEGPRTEASPGGTVAVTDRDGAPRRFIVQVDVTTRAEGALPPADRPEQREAIAAAQADLAAELDAGAVITDLPAIPFSVIEASEAEVADLRAAGVVRTAVPDFELTTSLDASTVQIGAPAVWPTTTGTGQTVAILDTGVRQAHTHFTGRIVNQACFADDSAQAGGAAVGNCPNGAASQTGGSSGQPCTAEDCDHGTHVAGIAAGNDPDGPYDGVARGASIMAVRVFHRINPTTSSAFLGDILAGLHHVYSQRNPFDIAAVNLSLGLGLFTGTCNNVDGGAIRSAVANLTSVGIPVVAASGNDGSTNSIGFPACVTGVISVGNVFTAKGGVGFEDKVVASSNASRSLDLLAPGAPIRSAGTGSNTATIVNQGTSMAAPHVTGAIALLTEARSEIDALPANERVRRIHALLDATGPCIKDPGNNITYRRLDIEDAVDFTGSPSAFFTDVRPCIWYEAAVNWLAFEGLANGYPDGTFRAGNDITRAEFTNMLWQLFDQPATVHEHTWSDGLPWIEHALDWLSDPDGPAAPDPLANGYPDGTFRPDNPITRGEVANMLWRAAGSPVVGDAPFTDVPLWLTQAVDWISDDPDDGGPLEPVATGYDDNTFRDRVAITRAEVSRMLQRYEAAVQP